MNTQTGELVHFTDDSPAFKAEMIAKGFIPITDREAKLAKVRLAGRESTVLPQDDPLRVRVTKRVGKPATPKQMRAIQRYLRSMGDEAFWQFVKDEAPDINASTGLSCGMAQRLLTLLDKANPAVEIVSQICANCGSVCIKDDNTGECEHPDSRRGTVLLEDTCSCWNQKNERSRAKAAALGEDL